MSENFGDIIHGLRLTRETVCVHCRKPFERGPTGEWAYRKHSKRSGYVPGAYYCSYRCMRADEKKESKK